MKKLEGLIKGRLKQVEKTSTVNVGEGVISYIYLLRLITTLFPMFVDHFFHYDDI